MQELINKNFKPIIKENLPEEIYHNDLTSVNSSSLKYIFYSEKAWHNAFTKKWTPPRSKALEFGSLIHKIVLEGPEFIQRYVVEPVFEAPTKEGEMSSRSKAALQAKKEWHVEQQKNARIVCTQEEIDKARWMLDAFLNHPDAMALLRNGIGEISGYAAHSETGLVGRARADFLSSQDGILVDLKTCLNITQNYFLNKRIIHEDFRYDLQMAMYKSIFEQCLGKELNHIVWIVLESEKPYECAVYEAPKDLMLAAESYYNYAMKKIAQAVKRGKFLPFQQGVEQLILPENFWYLEKAFQYE